jgi:hypothetical protein
VVETDSDDITSGGKRSGPEQQRQRAGERATVGPGAESHDVKARATDRVDGLRGQRRWLGRPQDRPSPVAGQYQGSRARGRREGDDPNAVALPTLPTAMFTV